MISPTDVKRNCTGCNYSLELCSKFWAEKRCCCPDCNHLPTVSASLVADELERLEKQYIETAKAKGVGEALREFILGIHSLHSSLRPAREEVRK